LSADVRAGIDASTPPNPDLRSEGAPTTTGSLRTIVPRRDHDWQKRYSRRLLITDGIVLIWVVYGTQLVWFGTGNAQLSLINDHRFSDVSYWALSGILVIAWLWALSLADSRSHRVIGTGSAEYIRVVDSSFRLFGAVAIIAFLFQIDLARGFFLISLPLGVLVLILLRWLWRHWLITKRVHGEYMNRVLLVGSGHSVRQIAHELARSPRAGYLVVGACVPSGRVADTIPGTDIPVMGNVDSVGRAVLATHADTVAVTSADDLPPEKVKEISWGLEAGRQHLVLAPSIADIAGPRIHMRPVSGLPLVHVETPRFSLGQRVIKRSADLVVAIITLVLASPLLAVLAIGVKLSSPGPILFRQRRVGYRGSEFTMLKFRSMVSNAEELLVTLQQTMRDSGNEVMFKMRDDPRVTRLGRLLRRYSLDELPQLLNVLGGSMSLVGPRPPLPSEVATYADHVHRRFLVKPGITGLWQISGRSSLSWEESVRLDLSYVENWSLLGDVSIFMKTARAALLPGDTAH
jgi:exopolysaccharide biosynthesis polyprenyl glycosylphosphotransferase